MWSCTWLCLLCLCLQSLDTYAGCNTAGRFGPDCQYQCHCVDNTRNNQSGCCDNGTKCERGWFGPSCQYQDLLASRTVTSEFSYPWLSDDDVTTCNNDSTQSIAIQWNRSYPITWIRIHISIQTKFRGVNIDLSNSKNITYNCNQSRTSLVEPNIKDIYCNIPDEVMKVTLRGDDVANLCSIYISGGRNLAVYQNALQSSDFSDKWLATNAVDGNRSGKSKDHCSHTANNDASPTWSLSFSKPYLINRYVLYNRLETCCQKRLTGFLLTSFDSDGNLVLNRTGPTQESNYYVVTTPSYKSVKQVNIRATFKNVTSGNVVLSLCEVETFGDCEIGWYGLDCQNKCHCAENNCDISGNCMEGSSCVNGWSGHACENLCNETYFGENCQNKCPVFCHENKCDRFNGSCSECRPGYRGDKCDKKCGPKFYGKSCELKCSSKCFNQECDQVKGTCQVCPTGKRGDFCDKECKKGFFGDGCKTQCSINCDGSDGCDPTNGKCLKGCVHGYQGATCNEKCSPGQYGQNCAFNCSEECFRNATQRWCNVTDGMCLLGCAQTPYLNQRNECQLFCGDTFETPIVNFTVPICLLVIGAVTVAAVLKTRRVRKRKRGGAIEMSTIDCTVGDNNLKATSLTKSNGKLRILNENVPCLENTSVAVSSLNTFLCTHSSQYFMKQFESVPEPVNVSHDAAHSDTNKSKNRYMDVCPYDHSRVHLQINEDANEGDYINASFIEAYRSQDLFIAAQGPNASSLHDFVRMLWEQGVEKVVMLTNLVEDGHVKCQSYWPDEGTITYGEISVKLTYVQVLADFTIRKLHLIRKNSLIHHVTQFHFTSWPDKGVPSSPWSLVDFQQRVLLLHTTSPVVVHCSAGVGRTGTFIALCNVLAEAEDRGRVNFFKELVRMRQNRVMMIQKSEQYVFLHQAAQVAVVCLGTSIRDLKINERMSSLEKKSIFRRSRMFKEFQNVCTVTEKFQEYKEESYIEDDSESDADQNDEQTAQEVNNDAKNRFISITPHKSYIAELTCESPDMGKYINAVLVPNFNKIDQQILTQLPLPNTVVDFWRLVMEYNVTLVVALEAGYAATDKSIGHHLPSKAGVPLSVGPFEIQGQEYNMSTLWEECRLSVRRHLTSTAPKTDCDTRDLIYLQSTFTDLNPKKLLVFTKQVKSYGTKEEERVLYMCRNGASTSGLVCVLNLLMNRLDEDGHLTVPLVVGAIKCIRPQVIPTFAQYKVLYQAMQIYNDVTGVHDDGTEWRDSSDHASEVDPCNDDEDVNANSPTLIVVRF